MQTPASLALDPDLISLLLTGTEPALCRTGQVCSSQGNDAGKESNTSTTPFAPPEYHPVTAARGRPKLHEAVVLMQSSPEGAQISLQ